MPNIVPFPFPMFFNIDGTPLDAGYIFIGTANQNPETNPMTVYWDQAATQPIAQPIRTLIGFPVRNGSPGNIYALNNFSITIKDKNGSIIFYLSKVNITQDLSRDIVSLKDFGAACDDSTDDTVPFALACASGRGFYIPTPTLINGNLTITQSKIKIFGDGKSSRLRFTTNGIGLAVSGGIESIIFRDIQFFSGNSNCNLLNIRGVNDQLIIDGCYFEGGGDQLTITSNSSSAGSYGIKIKDSVFDAAATHGINIAPADIGFAQAIAIKGNEFFGCKQSISASSGSGIFVDKCRFERIATLSGAQAAVHVDNCNQFVFRDNYCEENNNVAVVEIGGNVGHASIRENYYTLNPAAGAGMTSCKALNVSNSTGTDSIKFEDNYIVGGGTLGTVVDFKDVKRIRCKGNTFNVVTCSLGINSTCTPDQAEVYNNHFLGTYTTNTSNQTRFDSRIAAAKGRYNGLADTLSDSFNCSVSRTSAGLYSVSYVVGMTSNINTIVFGSSFVSNGTNVCAPEVISQDANGFVVQISPTGSGTGGAADTNNLSFAVFGEIANG